MRYTPTTTGTSVVTPTMSTGPLSSASALDRQPPNSLNRPSRGTQPAPSARPWWHPQGLQEVRNRWAANAIIECTKAEHPDDVA